MKKGRTHQLPRKKQGSTDPIRTRLKPNRSLWSLLGLLEKGHHLQVGSMENSSSGGFGCIRARAFFLSLSFPSKVRGRPGAAVLRGQSGMLIWGSSNVPKKLTRSPSVRKVADLML